LSPPNFKHKKIRNSKKTRFSYVWGGGFESQTPRRGMTRHVGKRSWRTALGLGAGGAQHVAADTGAWDDGETPVGLAPGHGDGAQGAARPDPRDAEIASLREALAKEKEGRVFDRVEMDAKLTEAANTFTVAQLEQLGASLRDECRRAATAERQTPQRLSLGGIANYTHAGWLAALKTHMPIWMSLCAGMQVAVEVVRVLDRPGFAVYGCLLHLLRLTRDVHRVPSSRVPHAPHHPP
jgi:hypothetical protein